MNSHSVAIVNDPRFAFHKTGFGHPESPKRVEFILKTLEQAKILTKETSLSPRFATKEELTLAHSPEYVSLTEKEALLCAKDEVRMLSTGDVMISQESFEIGKLAVGAVLVAVDAIMDRLYSSIFAVIRPPGHHASNSIGMGFCLFNNVVIGALYALKNYPEINRVLIVDWDLHHGNGTEDLVKFDPRIFYFSTHQSPLWPGTGQKEQKGCGNVCNIPVMPGKTSRQALLDAYTYELPQLMSHFKPDFVFISAGFDAHKADPLGNLELESEDFFTLTQTIKKIAETYSKGRVISVLEGGYNLPALAESALEHVKGLF